VEESELDVPEQASTPIVKQLTIGNEFAPIAKNNLLRMSAPFWTVLAIRAQSSNEPFANRSGSCMFGLWFQPTREPIWLHY
jgi:hypothetical protein